MAGEDPLAHLTPAQRAFADQIEAEVREWGAKAPMIGQTLTEEQRRQMLADVAEVARWQGIPAIRAYFEGDCIVIENAQPAGEG